MVAHVAGPSDVFTCEILGHGTAGVPDLRSAGVSAAEGRHEQTSNAASAPSLRLKQSILRSYIPQSDGAVWRASLDIEQGELLSQRADAQAWPQEFIKISITDRDAIEASMRNKPHLKSVLVLSLCSTNYATT